MKTIKTTLGDIKDIIAQIDNKRNIIDVSEHLNENDVTPGEPVLVFCEQTSSIAIHGKLQSEIRTGFLGLFKKKGAFMEVCFFSVDSESIRTPSPPFKKSLLFRTKKPSQ